MRIENDNRDAVLKELDERVRLALKAVGMQAVSDVTQDPIPVDTGLMRNSITYAISGEPPEKSSYRATKGNARGSYRGTAPNDDIPAVYIGTNVHYAKYLEFGTSKMKARPFLRVKLKANLGRYKEILLKYLQK